MRITIQRVKVKVHLVVMVRIRVWIRIGLVDEVGGVGLWDLFESWIVVGWNWCVKVVVGDESGCW